MAECKAVWNGEVIAESKKCITTEGNLYFPPDAVKRNFIKPSERQYTCPWKGQAGYYNLVVDGKVNRDAAWYYFRTTRDAKALKNYVAFDKSLGVEVEGEPVAHIEPPEGHRLDTP